MRPKIALIGIGMWGQNLARVLYNLKALEIICDTNSKSQIRAKKKYPKTKVVGDIRSILKDKNIEGVVIATPPSTHAALAKKMLQAGKHVMVEKPLALSVSDGKEMTALAKKLKRVFMVGHVLEYHPAVVKLRELMKQGKLGKLQYIYSHRLNFGKIRTEENALWSFAPHDVAILLRLMRIPPTSVSCSGHASIHSDVADSTVTTLHFSNGVQAHMYVSWLHPFKIQRLVLIGDKQMAVFDDTKDWSEKLVLFSHRVDWVDGRIPVARKAKGIKVKLQEKEPLKVECEHFLKCIQSRQTPFTDGASGVEVLKVLEAAQKSIQESGTPIYPNASHKPSSKKLRYFAHTTAVVDKGAKIGEGTKVWHYSHVMSGSKIGNKCILGQNCFVGPGVSIGNGVKVQNNVSIYEGVSLEDHVFCGPSVVFTNVMNPRSAIERKTEFRKTMVKRGATLGAHSTIVCGNTIGRYAFVGADALVTKDIPDYALVLGSPARVVSWMCECGIKLKFKKAKATWKAFHNKYQQLKSGKVKKTT